MYEISEEERSTKIGRTWDRGLNLVVNYVLYITGLMIGVSKVVEHSVWMEKQ